MITGSEFLIEKEQGMRIVQVVNTSVGATEKRKLEQTTVAARASCCRRVLISSTGVTLQWYPNILGLYRLQPGGGPLLYKRLSEESERFLYQPRGGRGRQFSWGVSNSPHQAWGWLKSGLPERCPDLIKKWAAFDRANKKMTVDPTLRVSCHKP